MAFISEVKIVQIMPCIAMSERIRFIAEFDRDISEIMPYLNTVIDGAIYNHAGPNLTIKKQERMIGISPNKIAAGKVIDLKDAQELTVWLKDLINDCYEKRETIKPSIERRKRLGALDVYKLLPANNCKKCAELTCMAFAVKLAQEQAGIMQCAELFSGDYNEKRDVLLNTLKSCGYKVPAVF
ncbi:MAG: hypothetical protein A2252_01605 [Elusimicrobia bacterium RIFOXYA2_FULL_39_19]|nr:MAG: hypothetical protein A2252_01605 [Elusimicrobia bacterium RIFOXYA2_FULL_39_19]